MIPVVAYLASLLMLGYFVHRHTVRLHAESTRLAKDNTRLRTMLASAEADSATVLSIEHDLHRAEDRAEWAELEASVARFRAESSEIALAFATFVHDGVPPVDAALLARGGDVDYPEVKASVVPIRGRKS